MTGPSVVVGGGSVVTLAISGRADRSTIERTLRIARPDQSHDAKTNPPRHHFNSEWAMRLRGKRVNDSVELPDCECNVVTATIIRIQ